MKQNKLFIVAISALVLTFGGCAKPVESKLFTDLNSCIEDPANTKEACEIAYKNAKEDAERTAPKYSSLADCRAEYGADMCQGGSSNNGSMSDIFMPMMAGYMIAGIVDDIGGSSYDDDRYPHTCFRCRRKNEQKRRGPD